MATEALGGPYGDDVAEVAKSDHQLRGGNRRVVSEDLLQDQVTVFRRRTLHPYRTAGRRNDLGPMGDWVIARESR
jgi:hypothetical protein